MTKQPSRNQLRIIGGKWRGRKIQFPQVQELRPTADRIRETVFNWLSGWVEGASCLDLFAGSGALGYEACSRGASAVTLVDRHPHIIAALGEAKDLLMATEVELVRAQAEEYLQSTRTKAQFDIVFLDPPFCYPHLDELLMAVENSQIMKPSAWIYLESAVNRAIVAPLNWRLQRCKQAGKVDYRLYQQSTFSTVEQR